MTHYFSEQWWFSLTLEALTDIHVGTGNLQYLEIDGELREVLEQAKDVEGKAFIPSTSFKGAARSLADSERNDVDVLFGQSKVVEGEVDPSSGRLVFFGARLKESCDAADMPGFDVETGTYTRPQHARDRNTKTVLPKYMFHAENVPAGSTFTLEGVFFGSGGTRNGLKGKVLPLLNAMASEQGFLVGAEKTRLGRMRITDKKVNFRCEKIQRKEAKVDGRIEISVSLKKKKKTHKLEPQALKELTLHCPGPMLIADPSEARSQPGENSDRKRVTRELRYETGKMAGWDRALRQSLRSLSGYLEATLDAASAKRLDEPFVPYVNFAHLTSTQRLFGVEGFKGLLSLHIFSARNEKFGTFPGLELDTLTQGALEHAAFVIECPVDGKLGILISIDTGRYTRLVAGLDEKEKNYDAALVARLNEYVSKNGLQAGAKVTRGYGWFKPFEMGLSLEREHDVTTVK